ncbi:hypothetical protein QUB80_00890 [Chlorogloeopsis sp. ULAP01]|nr:hypothetical protein [Chlorogloeopsis sp. ULAP01]MDM9379264.1 hypothetical protein [Chlorogloeopsis sp. ULAP01]
MDFGATAPLRVSRHKGASAVRSQCGVDALRAASRRVAPGVTWRDFAKSL